MQLMESYKKFRSFWHFRKIREAINNGDLCLAERLLVSKEAQEWKPIVFLISKADVDYGLGRLKRAKNGYEDAMKLAEQNASEIEPEDLRFLVAYSDFRRLSIDFEIAETQFENWVEVAKQVMSLPAKGILKRHIFISLN